VTHTIARLALRSCSRRIALAAVLAALYALAIVEPVSAQEAQGPASPVGNAVSGYSVTDWLNLILRLALVLVVIWAAIVAMRWWVKRMNGGVGSSNGHLQIVESRSLGPNRSLQLVRLGNRAVLLGVTNERISPVLEIDDPAEIEKLSRPTVVQRPPSSLKDAASRLGALTKWRPVVEFGSGSRKQASTAPTAPPDNGAPRPAFAAQRAGLPLRPPQRSRWMTLARRIVGLEDPPSRPRPARIPQAQAHAQARATAQSRATAPRAAAPAPAAARAPRSFAAASAAAAELPASRAVRARDGYRQNQIAEAQRAITSIRGQVPR
jgi:flagellar biosynthetic protein FliO